MKKILIIEDHDDVRENTAEILELARYEVATAENGKLGVEKALQDPPDLIICDIMMPVLDGYGVLHLLAKHEATAGIPFIFLSAKSEKTDVRKGMELGADDYLTKPFEGSELLKAVETRLRKTDAFRKSFPNNLEGVNSFMEEAGKSGKVALTSSEREIVSLKKKHLVFSEGRRPGFLYFVVSGKVKLYKVHDGGKELITGVFSDGEFFGYHAILEDGVYTENAQVLEDAELMLIPRTDFIALVENDREIARRFIRLLTSHIHENERKLLDMAYSSLRRKVASGLLDLAHKFSPGNEEAGFLDISRENLSQYIGSATESLVRTLSDFRAEKLIDIAEGKIKLLNVSKLKSMAN